MTLPNLPLETLLLFTRYPRPGLVKTRLIPALGAEGAARLQQRMTELMYRQALAMQEKRALRVEVYFDGGSTKEVRRWVPIGCAVKKQHGGDLGMRMRHAVNTAFASDAARTVIIGADCPFLTAELLDEAFNLLGTRDAVIGPAHDGGYYLLGLNRPADLLWENINWGGESVLRQTMDKCKAHNITVAMLPPLPDIDRPEDLALLANNLPELLTGIDI